MDTSIGNFQLTENQVKNIGILDVSPFKGVSVWENGDVIAVSDSIPSQSEVDALIEKINAAPDVLDKKILEQKFDINLMLGAMGLAFTGVDAVQLAPYLSAIQNYASAPFRNFKGIKDFIAGLVAMGKANQSQANSLYAIFAEQGINLGAY